MAQTFTVLNMAEVLPFPVDDPEVASKVNEELRLKYRYLDLRRPEMSRNLRLRSKVATAIRVFMDEQGFLEVETPILTRYTPGGARPLLVPSRPSPGNFFALAESPQQLKQLLMVAGQDRYYQIVRCFRDERASADRSVEFTQLDIEMSFVAEEDLYALMEPLFASIVKETQGIDVAVPFERMRYEDMMNRFGSDKADLRYGMELADLAPLFAETGFRAFAGVAEGGGQIRGFAAPGGGSLSRKQLDDLVTETKGRGAAGLVWLVVEADGSIRSPVEKHLSAAEVKGILDTTGASAGDLVLIVADKPSRTAVALDGLRRDLAERLSLIPEDEWKFVWMVEPPLFEWSDEEDRWMSMHHPFTAPAGDDLDPATAKARAYDLVLNGFELGGGSIRIHQPDVQRRVFEALGLSAGEIDEKFGHLLAAFRYGVPPHGGLAFGLDRVVMLMGGKEAIRDVIAFPKAQSGADPLTGAPAPASPEQLRDLGLRVIAEPPMAPAPTPEGAEG
jgi:aspartyl-tRNA synthetase